MSPVALPSEEQEQHRMASTRSPTTTTHIMEEEKKKDIELPTVEKDDEKEQQDGKVDNPTKDQEQDRYDKLQIVLEEITKLCTDDSDYDVFRQMGRVLNNNNNNNPNNAPTKLQGSNLTGGYTNYSFKIYLETDNEQQQPQD